MNSVRDIRAMLPEGMRLTPDGKPRAMEYFVYGGELLPLSAGARNTQNISIQNDADFVVFSAFGRVSDPADETTVVSDPAITVEIRDTSSGANWHNAPQAFGGVFSVTGLAAGGAAGLSGVYPFSRIVKAGGSIATTFANLLGATDRNVRYGYRVFKVYYHAADV